MICDRIMVLRRGVIVDSGKTSDVIGNPSDDYTKKLLDSIIDV
jgi:ABC-type dipeptide/oligopeptide/nickel transport system ATPase component